MEKISPLADNMNVYLDNSKESSKILLELWQSVFPKIVAAEVLVPYPLTESCYSPLRIFSPFLEIGQFCD